MTSRSTIDWVRIEIEYLAGEDSIREIADRHEISDAAIRKRAKKHGWVRRVRGCELREPAAPRAPVAACEPSDIVQRGQELVARMLEELDAVTSHAGALEQAIEEECAGDRGSGRRTSLLTAISVGGRAATLKALAAAYKTLNEASGPKGKKAAAQERADAINSRLRPIGAPSLKAVK